MTCSTSILTPVFDGHVSAAHRDFLRGQHSDTVSMASGARRGGRGSAAMQKPNGLTYMEGAHLEEAYLKSDIKAVPVLDPPTEQERYVASLQLDVIRCQWDSPYWTQHTPKRSGDTRLLRYTDKYQPDRRGASSSSSFLQQVPLQKDVFPPHLWESFTSSETRRMERRAFPATGHTAAKIDWDNLHLEEKKNGEGEEEPPPESDEEDLGDYEDEDDDDYAQNYFDNGEDDDDMDADGGDEAAFD